MDKDKGPSPRGEYQKRNSLKLVGFVFGLHIWRRVSEVDIQTGNLDNSTIGIRRCCPGGYSPCRSGTSFEALGNPDRRSMSLLGLLGLLESRLGDRSEGLIGTRTARRPRRFPCRSW